MQRDVDRSGRVMRRGLGFERVVSADRAPCAPRIGRIAGTVTRAPTLRALRCEAMAQQIQIGERKGRERARGVLREAAVAHLHEAP